MDRQVARHLGLAHHLVLDLLVAFLLQAILAILAMAHLGFLPDIHRRLGILVRLVAIHRLGILGRLVVIRLH